MQNIGVGRSSKQLAVISEKLSVNRLSIKNNVIRFFEFHNLLLLKYEELVNKVLTLVEK
jgi:hypothetical protein